LIRESYKTRQNQYSAKVVLGSQDADARKQQKQGVVMLVRTTADRASNTLADVGLASNSNSIVNLNEHTYKRGTEIFGEGEPAEYVYQVKNGSVRSYKLLADGRRQIGAFHLEGDLFGLTSGEFHRFTAEAIVTTTLRLLRRRSIEATARQDRALAGEMLKMTTQSLRHAEDHMLLLGRKDALERVAAFLVEMDQRMSGSERMTLPMTRRDIADYLGLTIETVSRALSKLRRDGAVRFLDTTQREIAI
jgi:CRP/FNR family nitrogen fixation transcriptional regulator